MTNVTHLEEPTFNDLVSEYARKRPKVDVLRLLEYKPVTVDELNVKFYRRFKSPSVVKSSSGASLNRIISDSERAAKRRK
jgi:hypothetical protein